MGLNSWRESQISCTSSAVIIISTARSSISPCSVGTNSCNGGSRKRMVTGLPSITSYKALKSPFWKGISAFSAFSLCSAVLARIICRIFGILSGSKNICSVLQRPIPSAPYFTALAASAGVSALVRTLSLRYLSAQSMIRPKLPLTEASTVLMSPL